LTLSKYGQDFPSVYIYCMYCIWIIDRVNLQFKHSLFNKIKILKSFERNLQKSFLVSVVTDYFL
jgi:hypothetical protein